MRRRALMAQKTEDNLFVYPLNRSDFPDYFTVTGTSIQINVEIGGVTNAYRINENFRRVVSTGFLYRNDLPIILIPGKQYILEMDVLANTSFTITISNSASQRISVSIPQSDSFYHFSSVITIPASYSEGCRSIWVLKQNLTGLFNVTLKDITLKEYEEATT